MSLQRRDPRRIVCPLCHAPVGEWCALEKTDTETRVLGHIHVERSRAAHGFRQRGAVPRTQLSIDGVDDE